MKAFIAVAALTALALGIASCSWQEPQGSSRPARKAAAALVQALQDCEFLAGQRTKWPSFRAIGFFSGVMQRAAPKLEAKKALRLLSIQSSMPD